jgi:hypothetical protein
MELVSSEGKHGKKKWKQVLDLGGIQFVVVAILFLLDRRWCLAILILETPDQFRVLEDSGRPYVVRENAAIIMPSQLLFVLCVCRISGITDYR